MKNGILVSSLVLALFLAGCGSSGSGDSGGDDPPSSDPSVIESVSTIDPKDMASSGATTYPASLNDFEEFVTLLKKDSSFSSPSSAFRSKIDQIGADCRTFTTKKSIAETLSFSSEPINPCYSITTISGTSPSSFSASATTTDGGVLDIDYFTNFMSGSASASLKVSAAGAGFPSDSGVKFFKAKLNAGGKASLGSQMGKAKRELADLTAKFALSGVLGISAYVDRSGVKFGGKIVAKLDGSGSVTDAPPLSVLSNPSSYFSDVTGTITVYDDSNTVRFTKTDASIVADLANLLKEI